MKCHRLPTRHGRLLLEDSVAVYSNWLLRKLRCAAESKQLHGLTAKVDSFERVACVRPCIPILVYALRLVVFKRPSETARGSGRDGDIFQGRE